MNAQHRSETDEHYTPAKTVEAARRALGGGIDLDPASSRLANETVGASSFFVKNDNGLNELWNGRVLLNPPGGRLSNASSQKVWFCKLLCEYVMGRVVSAVYVGFSLEILQSAQNLPLDLPTPLDFPCCFPSARMAFDTPVNGRLVRGKSPTHANVIVFLPPKDDHVVGVERFVAAFSPLGRVIVPQFEVTAARSATVEAIVRSAVAAHGRATATEELLVSLLKRQAAR